MSRRRIHGVAGRARRALATSLTLALLLLGAVGLAPGCRSLPKGELEERLLALDKNAPLRADGWRTASVALDVRGARRELELRYLFAPAVEPTEGAAPVVLVHGTPSTATTWVEVMYGGDGFEGLSAARDVYALEVVGHGVAPGDLEPYDFDLCARFVAAAVQALDLPPAHLAGCSYGGEMAWRAALDHPELFASLTLLDSSGYARADGDWLPEEREMRENSLADKGWWLNSRARIEAALAPHFRELPPDRVEEFFLVCENAPNWRAMIDLARDEEGRRQDELGELAVPTLVVWGADDIAYPLERYGERFARDIPGARLLALPETGHYPHEERPARFLAALTAFLDEVEAPR